MVLGFGMAIVVFACLSHPGRHRAEAIDPSVDLLKKQAEPIFRKSRRLIHWQFFALPHLRRFFLFHIRPVEVLSAGMGYSGDRKLLD